MLVNFTPRTALSYDVVRSFRVEFVDDPVWTLAAIFLKKGKISPESDESEMGDKDLKVLKKDIGEEPGGKDAEFFQVFLDVAVPFAPDEVQHWVLPPLRQDSPLDLCEALAFEAGGAVEDHV